MSNSDRPSPTAVVDVANQRMTVLRGGSVVRVYPVSTAANGVGAEADSGKTPPGRHRVCRMFGHRAAPGQVFVSRRAVRGQVLPPSEWRGRGERDYVLTRILWLEGLEPGVNSGRGVDSRERYVYVHGTNQEQLLGTPVSHGCIRMSNADVVEFFDFVKRNRGIVVDVVRGPVDATAESAVTA